MRKVLFVSVAFAGLVLGLTSCGGGATSNPGTSTSQAEVDYSTSIIMWAPTEEQPVFESVLKTYNDAQTSAKAKLNVTFKNVSEADGGTTLAADPKVANYPALAAIADDQLNNLVSKGIVNKLPGMYSASIKTDDTAFAVQCATNGGELYGYPISSDNGYFLWYNGDALQDTQIKDLETMLKAVKAAGKKMYLKMEDSWYASMINLSQGINGPDSVKWKSTKAEDGTTSITYDINWDNEIGVAAVTAMNALLQPYFEDGTLIGGGDDPLVNGFTDGTVVAGISGLWNENALAAVTENLKAAELPSFKVNGTSHHLGSFSGSKMYIVNGYATIGEQRAANKLASLLTSEAGQLVRFDKRKAIPCNVAAAASDAVTSKASVGSIAFKAQQAYAAVQSTSAESKYWPAVETIGKAVINGVLPEKAPTWAEFMKQQCDLLRNAA